MKKQMLAVAAMFGAIMFSTNAHAVMVAGWDFSQYLGPNLLSIDGAEFTDTLDANYSNLLTTGFDTGIGAAEFGRMYINGQFGSTAVPIGTGLEQVVPLNPSLVSNLTAPVQGFGDNQFDSFEVSINQGQFLANSLAMIAGDAVNIVFEVDLRSTLPGTDWNVSFGARTVGASAGRGFDVEFSTDGISYAPVGTANVTPVDTLFEFDFGDGLVSDRLFVRFAIDAPNQLQVDSALFDNVAIKATLIPEPGTALLLLAGLAGLTVHGRRVA